MTSAIHHQPEQHRFATEVEGHLAKLEYRQHGDVLTIVHTEVPPPLEGRGLGGDLVRAALEHAEATGLKVDPVCSYARAYMERHPETMRLHV